MLTTDAPSLNKALDLEMKRFGHTGREFAVYVTPPPGTEVIPASRMLSDDHFMDFCRRSLIGWSDDPAAENPQATVSWMMRFYVSCVVGGAMIPLVQGVAFDLSIPSVSFVMVGDFPMGLVIDLGTEAVTCAERPTSWPIQGRKLDTVDELREHVTVSLFRDHLIPAFAKATEIVPLAPSVLWGHVVEMIDLFCEDGYDFHRPSEVDMLEADRSALLFAESIPGIDGPSPLLGLMDWEIVDDPRYRRPQQVRKACCINFLIGGRNKDGLNIDSYCRSCARISKDERLVMWRIFADEQGW